MLLWCAKHENALPYVRYVVICFDPSSTAYQHLTLTAYETRSSQPKLSDLACHNP